MSEADFDRSELLDDDVIDGEYPPEQPLGVNERLTPEQEQMGDSLERRRAREEPDRWEAEPVDDSVGPLVAPGDESGEDREAEEVALEARDRWAAARDVVQELEEVEPAEEAAMHLTEEPPMGDGDGYVDADDRTVPPGEEEDRPI